MSKLKLLGLSCMLALAAFTAPAFAQYMYLDANGDGINSPADTLALTAPTTLTIYLDSDHDRDGTLRTCNAHTGASTAGSALDFFSYTIVLTSSGGTVVWGTFTPDNSAYTPLGPDLADTLDTEFTRVRPAGSVTPAGLVKLGTISVAVVSGAPRIDIGTSTAADPFGFGTGFGTSCEGSEYRNTYVLGTDWFDADGTKATDLPPQVSAPSTVSGVVGSAIIIPAPTTRRGRLSGLPPARIPVPTWSRSPQLIRSQLPRGRKPMSLVRARRVESVRFAYNYPALVSRLMRTFSTRSAQGEIAESLPTSPEIAAKSMCPCSRAVRPVTGGIES